MCNYSPIVVTDNDLMLKKGAPVMVIGDSQF